VARPLIGLTCFYSTDLDVAAQLEVTRIPQMVRKAVLYLDLLFIDG